MSRIDAESEIVWWVNETQWQGDTTPGGRLWLYPHCMTRGENGTFVVAGMTDGTLTGGDFIISNKVGVMHIAKFRDPDLVGVECPETYILAAILLIALYEAWRRTRQTRDQNEPDAEGA